MTIKLNNIVTYKNILYASAIDQCTLYILKKHR